MESKVKLQVRKIIAAKLLPLEINDDGICLDFEQLQHSSLGHDGLIWLELCFEDWSDFEGLF